MNKHQPEQGRLDSSATHHLTQPSTILDRRYVKRPAASNAGKYNSSSTRPRIERDVVAPSRLINLGVHNQDLSHAVAIPVADEVMSDDYDELDEIVYDYSEDAASAEFAAEMDEIMDEASAIETTVDDGAAAEEDADNYYTPVTMAEVLTEEATTNSSAMPNNFNTQAYSSYENSYSSMNNSYSEPTASYSDTNKSCSTPDSSYSGVSSMYSDMMNAYAHGYYTDPSDINPTTEANDMNNFNPASEYNEPDEATLDKMKQSMMQDLVNNVSAPVEPAPESAEDYSTDTTDYTAPKTTESIDAISRATSDALASIRMATDNADVSDQLASIQAFASSIKSDPSPEMAELGNTIEKFTNVALKSTKAKEAAEHKVAASVNRSNKISASTGRINRAPMSAASRTSHVMDMPAKSKVSLARTPRTTSSRAANPAMHKTVSRPANKSINRTPTNSRRPTTTKPRYTEPSTSVLEQAVRSISNMDDTPSKKTNTKTKKVRTRRRKGSVPRFLLAFGCAAACIGGIVYFVSTNIPDISVQVAAMQTGIEASYPSYVPRDYSLGDIFSENGRLTMKFDGPDDASFTLVEEKSSWDSSALQRNFVEPTWKDNYTTTHEQGITIYICGSDAAWVNGGVLYKITSSNNNLTKKQLRNIVTSL